VPAELSVNQVQRVLSLRTFRAFSTLSPAELAVIAENATPRFFPSGSELLRPGVPVRAIHFIVRGSVEMMREGRPPLVLGAQDVVGGLAALTQDPKGEQVVAREETVTLELERDSMEEVFEDNFPIFLGVLRAMAHTQLVLRRRLGPEAGFAPPDGPNPVRPVGKLDLVEKIFFLRRTMSFARTRIEALADLAQESNELVVPKGRQIWSAGDVADIVVMPVSGIIDCVSEDGKQTFGFGPGSIIGGLDSFAGEPRWFTASARTALRALSIEAQTLLDVVEDNMEMTTDMLRVFANVVRELQDRVGDPGDQAIA
jgi:CRP-like cAMP-binding protein